MRSAHPAAKQTSPPKMWDSSSSLSQQKQPLPQIKPMDKERQVIRGKTTAHAFQQ